MRIDKALCIDDLGRLAKRRMPKILFDLLDSGVEDEHGLFRNIQAYRDYRLLPRYLTDIEHRDQGCSLWGHEYAASFGIGPTGFAGLFRPGADVDLAAAAGEENIPVIISGASFASIEELVKINPALWYHLYPAKDGWITTDIVSRVQDAGVGVLVVTVDNPVYPKRERDMRNGFSLPFKPRLSTVLQALTHPAWTIDYLRSGGVPVMDTWARYAPKGSNGSAVANFFRSQSPSLQTWRDMEALRRQWRGRFVIKGIQHPDDAVRAAEIGVDGIVVSNHGGKSFDPLPSPLETFPEVKQAVGQRIPVMLDCGVRRGSDIVIAKCLGADMVFVGRATLYGEVAAGRPGLDHAISILRQETDMTLAMIGCARARDLTSEYLLGPGTDQRQIRQSRSERAPKRASSPKKPASVRRTPKAGANPR